MSQSRQGAAVVDSSVIIGTPSGEDYEEYEYAPMLEGRQLFYAEISDEEVFDHFQELVAARHLPPEKAVALAGEKLKGMKMLLETPEISKVAKRLCEGYIHCWPGSDIEDDWNDILIAATAIEHRMPVITHDDIFLKLEFMTHKQKPSRRLSVETSRPKLSNASWQKPRKKLHLVPRI